MGNCRSQVECRRTAFSNLAIRVQTVTVAHRKGAVVCTDFAPIGRTPHLNMRNVATYTPFFAACDHWAELGDNQPTAF